MPNNFRDTRVPPIGEIVVYPTHGCNTQGGQSGTPMTVIDERGQHRLYGMLKGRTFLYREWEGKGPRWYGRFIPVEQLAADVENAVLEMKRSS